jgi:multiple antibiotic resistance protein
MANFEQMINAFTTLIVTIDPPGLAPIFLGLTHGMNASERRATALRGTIIAFIILAVFAVAGEGILKTMGISIGAFRIAGGLLLFVISFEMIFDRREARKQKTSETAVMVDQVHNIATFPLALPLIAGPGAISATILLAGSFQGPVDRIGLIAVLAFCVLLVFLALSISGQIDKLLGTSGRAILTRLLGVLLAALSVQFVIDGLKSVMAT